MTDDPYLGYLVWWSVAHHSSLDYTLMVEAMRGRLDVKIPPPPHPSDVFRRVSQLKQTFPLEDKQTLELSLVSVQSARPDVTLNRHLVATVKNEFGVVQGITKAGDVAFYRPPRSQMSKARVRIVPIRGHMYETEIQTFVRFVRSEYDKGVAGAVDSQGIRRVTREHLAAHGGFYLNGAYFIESLAPAQALTELFEALGDDGFLHIVPLVDTPDQRAFLTRRRPTGSASA